MKSLIHNQTIFLHTITSAEFHMDRLHFTSSTIAPFTIAYHVHGNAPHPIDYTKYLIEVRSVIHDGVTDISENRK